MNKLALLLFSLVSISAFAQNEYTAETKPIVEEGKRLYQSEMASWYGTDLFLAAYKERGNIGGYFSYTENNTSKCVFFSRSSEPMVIGTISFDSTYNTKTALVDVSARAFSALESNLYTIRRVALEEIDNDTLFKSYKNTSLNLIPLIAGNEKKVYVLTGTGQDGIVILGNDYLLTFNTDNKIISKKALHRNIIPIHYGSKETEGKEIEGTMHTHLPETGDFITATDICTLMLYQKFTKWKQHNVVSKNYLNIWNGLTNELVVIPMSTIEKINQDQEKRNARKDK
jgi:hypothetical protein